MAFIGKNQQKNRIREKNCPVKRGLVQQVLTPEFATRTALCNFVIFVRVANPVKHRPLVSNQPYECEPLQFRKAR